MVVKEKLKFKNPLTPTRLGGDAPDERKQRYRFGVFCRQVHPCSRRLSRKRDRDTVNLTDPSKYIREWLGSTAASPLLSGWI